MPLHVAPFLREMEKAREAVSLIQVLNSVAYTEVGNAETAGTRPTPTAPYGFFYFGQSRQTPTL
jgi:hypothetical protein